MPFGSSGCIQGLAERHPRNPGLRVLLSVTSVVKMMSFYPASLQLHTPSPLLIASFTKEDSEKHRGKCKSHRIKITLEVLESTFIVAQ